LPATKERGEGRGEENFRKLTDDNPASSNSATELLLSPTLSSIPWRRGSSSRPFSRWLSLVAQMSRDRITILHVYKDCHVYNALFGSMLLLARHTDFKKCDLRLCVFSYRKNAWGDEFEQLGGKIVDLGATNTESPAVIFKLRDYFRKERPHIV